MIFAIYALICSVLLPVFVGHEIYKKFNKEVKPNEVHRETEVDSEQS